MLQFQQYDASIGISPKSNDYDVDRGCYECYSRSDFHILVQNGNQGRSHRHGYFYGRIHSIRHVPLYRERKFDSFPQTFIPVTRTDHTQYRIYRYVSVPNNLTASAVAIFMNTSLQKYGGDTAIGAFGIINSYGMLIVMLIIGLCQGMQPIVGFNFGAGNLQRMQKALTLTATVATIITSLGFIGSTFFPHYLARAFTTDTHLIDVSSVGLRITMMMFPIVGAQIVITNFFQSIGKASISIFLSLSRQVLFLIPAILLLPRIWGLDGVWSASPTADGIATLITVWVLFMQRKLFKPNTKIGNQ